MGCACSEDNTKNNKQYKLSPLKKIFLKILFKENFYVIILDVIILILIIMYPDIEIIW